MNIIARPEPPWGYYVDHLPDLDVTTAQTDEGESYTVESHTSFLAHVELIDGEKFLLTPRPRDREPHAGEIRELATALLVVADTLESYGGCVGCGQRCDGSCGQW